MVFIAIAVITPLVAIFLMVIYVKSHRANTNANKVSHITEKHSAPRPESAINITNVSIFTP